MSPVIRMAAAYCAAANWADDVITDKAFRDHAEKACGSLWRSFRGIDRVFDNEMIEQCGHDFWLTRQGHGTGFWDRPDNTYGNAANREKLNNYAQFVGEFYDFVSEPRERGTL